jgi:hypothetical protein
MPNNEEQKVGAPPTPEITIRTMKSDIRSIASGEVSPIPEKIPAKELEKIAVGPIKVISEAVKEEKPRKKLGTIIAVVIILLMGFGVLIYFLIK